MKKSGFLKALAALMLFVSVVIGALAVISMIFAFENGAQFDGGSGLAQDVARELSWHYAEAIADHYEALNYGSISNGIKHSFDYNYSEDRTNVRYKVTTEDGNILFNNLPHSDDQTSYTISNTVREIPELFVFEEKSMSFDDLRSVQFFRDQLEETKEILRWEVSETDNVYLKYKVTYQVGEIRTKEIRVSAGIPIEAKPVDYIYWVFQYIALISMYYNWVIGLAVLTLLIAVLCSVFICASAGYSKKTDSIHLGFFAKLPLEVYLALIGSVLVGCIGLIEEYQNVIVLITVPIVLLIIFIGMLFSLSARLKSSRWYKNCIIIKLLALIYKYFLCTLALIIKKLFSVFARINLYWKTALTEITFFLLYFIGALSVYDGGILIIFFAFIFHISILIKFILDLRKLEKLGADIRSGNVKAKAESSKLLPSLRNHAENLNGISAAIDDAVKKTIKSERMKSELITNVSHDIKTPLTSLINYVGLLKQEGLSSKRATEYLEVLDRQSARLKKLTEDLVEASKAASGNVNAEPENTDLDIILSQALCEYEDKMNDKNLNIVVRKDNDSNMVFADGKLVWRIFDNLLSNVCKYALCGTRVFIEISRCSDRVITVFKNISSEQLEHSAEELMERFVRDDSSRNTEGSGLGLSIAKSLTELQGGSFDIETDGDLFKVTVSLPIGD